MSLEAGPTAHTGLLSLYAYYQFIASVRPFKRTGYVQWLNARLAPPASCGMRHECTNGDGLLQGSA